MFNEVTTQLLKGFGTTCELFFITLICALPLGLILAFCSMSKFKPLKWITDTFVWIIRGTPLMLQIFTIFYIPGILWGVPFKSRMIAALIAFSVNYAAYFSVIYRGGIESISKGQFEAGQVLGMKKHQIFFKIILPQVIKRILPPMSNEIITLVKDTSLAQVISVADIFFEAGKFTATHALIWPLFYTGVFYLVFVGILTLLFNFIEKKMNYYKV